MSVEAINTDSSDLEFESDRSLSTLWNGRLIHHEANPILEIVFTQMINGLNSQNNPQIDHFNYPIGICPQGHVAYHIYHQLNQPPINLCDEKKEWCIFEYYHFLAFLRGDYSTEATRAK